jgi:phosphoglucomutase
VGIKINTHDGSPALDETVNRIHELQNSVTEIRLASYNEAVQAGHIQECDVIALYTRLLDDIFDFEDIRTRLADRRFHAAFDGMHGAAGPFAREIFIHSLGMNARIIREEPREDLGGHDESGEPMHPEPDFDFIGQLMEMNASGKYELVAAWDSDVDRRLDGGDGFFLESADEFAVFARYSHLIKIEDLFDKTMFFCRSTVTAHTIDLMEEYLQKKFPNREVKAIQTPTGFKWIADLGNWGVEESNGVGNPYLREKDGIFSTFFLLKIMLHTGKTPRELMEETWNDFGRVYFTRGEVSGENESEKEELVAILDSADRDKGTRFGSLTLEGAEKWDYMHPETGELAARGAAWVLYFSEGNTVKARFSGTGSGGYTLRVYCSKYDREYDRAKSEITMPMKEAFNAFLQSRGFSGEAHSYTDAHQPDPYK